MLIFRNSTPRQDAVPELLRGSEIHGFHTMEDLDMGKILQDASSRWLRPNEIHAILSNSSKFTVYVKPVDLPQSGTLVLFDRKMLRNFRKDGHVWKKKSDGKTVKEAHEHLKVGDEERIHVYYAHGQDKPNFVRRCYWLLDKDLERVVLVHYREVLEDDTSRREYKEPVLLSGSSISPSSPLYPASFSPVSGTSVTYASSNTLTEKDPTVARESYAGGESDAEEIMITQTMSDMNQELVPTDAMFDWEDLLQQQIFNHSHVSRGYEENVTCEGDVSDLPSISSFQAQPSSTSCGPQISRFTGKGDKILKESERGYGPSVEESNSLLGTMGMPEENIFQSQGSFGRWMSSVLDNSWDPLTDEQIEFPTSAGQDLKPHLKDRMPLQDIIFEIAEVLPLRGLATEWTKMLIVGNFHKSYVHLVESRILCVFGDAPVHAEMVQAGVLRCNAPPQPSGLYNFYLSFDGHTPISQIMCFEYYVVSIPSVDNSSSAPKLDENKWEDFELKRRLAHLLYSTTSGMSNFTSKVPPKALTEAKRFLQSTSLHEQEWISLSKFRNDDDASFLQSSLGLLDLTLKLKLQEWLLEKIIEGGVATVRDQQGQGIIHLCTILNYAWAIRLISQAGTSIDFRDANGWTGLHWAARLGRKEMVVTLLREGADPSLVSDPSPEYPGGCTPADLASQHGYDGLAAYLAEKGLTKHFEKMSLAGNAQGTVQPDSAIDSLQFTNITEEDLCLKDSLAALRTAANAASRIQEAFRQRSLKLHEKLTKDNNSEDEARRIISALKIQHAFQRRRERKQLNAVMRIQQKFRVWKARKDFLNMRQQAIKIQAAFRGHQVRRQYHKLVWSVGILEKVILRWRLKRKGLRGHHVNPVVAVQAQDDNVEEDFFRISRKQAEDRVERSVTRVQAMFRSHRSRAEYRKMKLLYEQTMAEQGEPLDKD